MTYISNLATVQDVLRDMVGSGLAAQADLVAHKISRRLMQGYTTGRWSHGEAGVAGSVQTQVFMDRGETNFARIWSDTPHALYWEIGHLNVFMDGPIVSEDGVRTGPIRRVEIWVPMLNDTGNEQVLRFAEAAQRVMESRSGY